MPPNRRPNPLPGAALRGESVSTEEHVWISAAPDVCFVTGWALKRRSRSAVDVCVPNLLACPVSSRDLLVGAPVHDRPALRCFGHEDHDTAGLKVTKLPRSAYAPSSRNTARARSIATSWIAACEPDRFVQGVARRARAKLLLLLILIGADVAVAGTVALRGKRDVARWRSESLRHCSGVMSLPWTPQPVSQVWRSWGCVMLVQCLSRAGRNSRGFGTNCDHMGRTRSAEHDPLLGGWCHVP